MINMETGHQNKQNKNKQKNVIHDSVWAVL